MSPPKAAVAAPLPPNALETLRALTPPQRSLSPFESLRIAELQAARLLALADITIPAVSGTIVADLLGLQVSTRPGLPTSGLTTATRNGWIVVLSADDPRGRRRFSLFHEIKHIIDDPFIDWLYPSRGILTGDLQAERACDQFAAAVLMPKAWIKRDWGTGHQDVKKLAARYGVSVAAMGVRLGQLGLTRIDEGHARGSLAYFTHQARRAAS